MSEHGTMNFFKESGEQIRDVASQANNNARRAARGLQGEVKRAVFVGKNVAKRAADAVVGPINRAEHHEDHVVLNVTRTIQVDGYSCGAQCALAILRCFGKGRSAQRTARLLGTDADGTTLASLRKLFESRGLRPVILRKPTKGSLIRAIDEGAPVLVSMDGDHWAVIYGYGRGVIYLMDPSLLRARRAEWKWTEFKARWDGWAMAVKLRS